MLLLMLIKLYLQYFNMDFQLNSLKTHFSNMYTITAMSNMDSHASDENAVLLNSEFG